MHEGRKHIIVLLLYDCFTRERKLCRNESQYTWCGGAAGGNITR